MAVRLPSRGFAWAALAAFALSAVAQAAPNAAQTSSAARARIIRPLSVSSTAQMSFGKLQYNPASGPAVSPVDLSASAPVTRTSANVQLLSGGGETPAIRVVTGQPNAIYRVTTPTVAASTPGGLTVNTFTIWSASRGDITASRLGQLNSSGTDTVRVGASLQVPIKTKNDTYTANVPITISYE